MIIAAFAVSAVPAALASARTPPPLWLHAPGHFAYCQWNYGSTILCFSSVSGRWIRIKRIYEGEILVVGKGQAARAKWISHQRLTTGHDSSLVGFRRTTDVQAVDQYGWYDDRPASGYAIKCSAVPAFFKCWVKGTRFWFKPDGSFGLVRG